MFFSELYLGLYKAHRSKIFPLFLRRQNLGNNENVGYNEVERVPKEAHNTLIWMR